MSLIDKDIFIEAFRNIRRQRIIGYLTLLGIIIGIASVVGLISIMQGFNLSVEERFETMGSTTIVVMPGSSFADSFFAKLEEDDAKVLESIRGVDYATPLYFTTKTILFDNEKKSLLLIGIDPEKQENFGRVGLLGLAEGRKLNSNERGGILIGSTLAKDVFKKDIKIKQNLYLNGHSLTVVGIIKPQGLSYGSFFDSSVIINYKYLKEIINEPLTPFRIFVKVFDKDEVERVKNEIEEVLKKKHGKKDFSVLSQQQIRERATSVLAVINIVLIGIAAISLVVGGLGIMNTMFMAITERTKEIGIMKSVGAKNSFILFLFLTESSMIGFIGGVIGVILGFSFSFVVHNLAKLIGLNLEYYVSIELILGALVFSILVGALSGLLPSLRASRLDPIEALREF
ncbi:MAG: ABC transporter permease [Candidatus Diapherotrites archaeon]|nr:ABC transporter permease [Candidatus Diapherotrites archaeon]